MQVERFATSLSISPSRCLQYWLLLAAQVQKAMVLSPLISKAMLSASPWLPSMVTPRTAGLSNHIDHTSRGWKINFTPKYKTGAFLMLRAPLAAHGAAAASGLGYAA
jgi:hypothetical protein